MISFFPEFYPDELVYSLFARYYTRSGYISLTYAIDDLYVHKYTTPDTEFINELKSDAVELLTKDMDMATIIEKHTMFPSYARFLPLERRQEAFSELLDMKGNFNNLLAIPKNQRGKDRMLRFCPECVQEDRVKYGETYWHRMHQIHGLRICPVHKCYLCDSSVSMNRKATPSLIEAENEISILISKKCLNEPELELSEYVNDLFQSSLDVECSVPIGEYLHSRLNAEKYKSDSGASTKLELLFQDYKSFYSGCECMEQWQIQKLFNGYRWQFYEVCQVALFIGVTAQELSSVSHLPMDIQRHSVYEQIARELGYDYDTVKKIGNAVLKRYQSQGRIQRKCGAKEYAWSKMDTELLPEVRKTIHNLYGSGDKRPQRITVNLVRREMGLPDKRFDKLPMCKAEILKYKESQNEYWARECIWAYQVLIDNGMPVSWKQIRNLTNMRNIDFQNCKPFLSIHTDNATADIISELL